MPHPKRRKSKAKRDKRRTHHKAILPQLTNCTLTKQTHLFHHAYWHDDILYYKGQIILQKSYFR